MWRGVGGRFLFSWEELGEVRYGWYGDGGREVGIGGLTEDFLRDVCWEAGGWDSGFWRCCLGGCGERTGGDRGERGEGAEDIVPLVEW